MAKEKKSEAVATGPDDFTDRIYAEVEKDFGAGIMIDGASALKDVPQVIPWSPALDIILGGGIEEGSCVGITGHPKTGKTTAALCLAAQAQKPENGGRPVYYAKIEGRLSLTHLRGIKGLDLAKGRFTIIKSREGLILSAQNYLDILENIIKTVPGALVILDSISALCDEKEQSEGVGVETRGGGAKLFSQWCRRLNQIIPVNRSIVVGITHLISNTSGMGAQYAERAARMWLYAKDYDLRTVMKTAWKAGERQIGLDIKWACNTSKSGPPGLTINSFIRFGTGIDGLFEGISLGMSANLIKKAGAWMTLSFLAKDEHRHLLGGSEPPKYQGSEKVYEALLEHPEWANALLREVNEISACLVGGGGE